MWNFDLRPRKGKLSWVYYVMICPRIVVFKGESNESWRFECSGSFSSLCFSLHSCTLSVSKLLRRWAQFWALNPSALAQDSEQVTWFLSARFHTHVCTQSAKWTTTTFQIFRGNKWNQVCDHSKWCLHMIFNKTHFCALNALICEIMEHFI